MAALSFESWWAEQGLVINPWRYRRCWNAAIALVEAQKTPTNSAMDEIARLEKILLVAERNSGTVTVTNFIKEQIAQLRQ